jgi:hypothetical protein
MKLCQLVALSKGKKATAEKVITKVYHLFQKDTLFNGLERTYEPKDDDGEKLPPESVRVQWNVNDVLIEVRTSVANLFDIVASQDAGNTRAQANVVVDGKVVLSQVPAVTLIFLEKQLKDLATFVGKIPTLDPSQAWEYNDSSDLYETPVIQKHRSPKVERPIVLYDATDKHPAQTQLITKTELAGYWNEKKLSGAWPAKRRNEVLQKIAKLKDAVVLAREEANGYETDTTEIGEEIFNFLLK